MNIGTLAKLTSTSVRSIRHHEEKGLLKAERGANAYRHFEENAATQVRQIKRMLKMGFSLDEIASFPGCMINNPKETLCPVAAAAHEHKLAEIERQMRELEKQREKLLHILRDA